MKKPVTIARIFIMSKYAGSHPAKKTATAIKRITRGVKKMKFGSKVVIYRLFFLKIELMTRPESMNASNAMITDMPNETLPASCTYTGLEVADMIEAESGSARV